MEWMLQVFREKATNPEVCTLQNYPWEVTEKKTFSEKKKKIEEICCQQNCLRRKAKRSYIKRRKLPWVGNSALHEERKSIKEGKVKVKWKLLFFLFLDDISLFKIILTDYVCLYIICILCIYLYIYTHILMSMCMLI